MKKTGFTKCAVFICILTILSIMSCSNSSSNVEAKTDNAGVVDGIVVKAWKGKGSGGEDRAKSREKGVPVYVATGDDSDGAQTVIVNQKPSQLLEAGHYYELTTEVLAEGLSKNFDFIASIRAGKTHDIYEVYDRAETWRKLTLLLNPTATSNPNYVAIRLYGSGQVWATPFKYREVDKSEFDRLLKELKVQKEADALKRLERVMVKASATLPLAVADSPALFKAWATEEEQFPPPPAGWKQVPGERADLAADMSEKLHKSGYVVYTRNMATPIYLESVPRPNELIEKLTAAATPGEYEPFNFAIYSERLLDGITLKVSDLVSEKGNRISRSNIDVRTVNFVRKIKDKTKRTYFLMPMTLSKGPGFVDARTSRRYWLTVYVPKSAKAGVYKSTIELTLGNAPIQKIPVEFTVLPFDLLDPPVVRFMWSPKVAFPANDEKMNIDLREHGMTTMMLGGEVKTRDRKVDQQDIDHMVSSINAGMIMHKKLGFRDIPIGGISNNQIINYWDKSINWFRFWPITKELDDEFISTYRRVFLEEGRKRKWPEIYHYIVDEPGGANPKNLEPTQHYLSLFKKRLPELKTFVTVGGGMKQGYDEIGMLSRNLNVTATNYVTKDVVERLGKLGSSFWVYNGSSLNAEPIKERFFYGWYSWKVGAQGIGQWTYAWTGRPYGEVFRDDRQDYALETKNGFVPTVGLELIREGVDDYKYIYTLTRLIDLGNKSGNKSFQKSAKDATKILMDLRSRINLNYQRGSDVPESKVVGISPDELSTFRDKLAYATIQMITSSKMSWPTLREKLIGMPPALPIALKESDWNSSAVSQPGSEDLLAGTRFGGLLSDWKIQVWKGKGGGEFESKVLFGKNKAAKLYIESEGKDDNAVLVIIKPPAKLKAGVKFRLSAWVKAENVTQYAALFAAIRGGGVSDAMSARVKGTTDWQQIWVEFTPEDDTSIQYLALRLWGRGTIYSNRLVLQEIK